MSHIPGPTWSSTRLPHIPALCGKCFDLCTPEEQAVALVIRRLVSLQPLNGQSFYIPNREPLCKPGVGAGPWTISYDEVE